MLREGLSGIALNEFAFRKTESGSNSRQSPASNPHRGGMTGRREVETTLLAPRATFNRHPFAHCRTLCVQRIAMSRGNSRRTTRAPGPAHVFSVATPQDSLAALPSVRSWDQVMPNASGSCHFSPERPGRAARRARSSTSRSPVSGAVATKLHRRQFAMSSRVHSEEAADALCTNQLTSLRSP